MKRNTLWIVAMLWLATVLLAGCNSKEVWDVDYDLSTEIGRQLHCYAQFQKNVRANSYWVEWANEVNNWFGAVVEWKVTADGDEYNLVCNYSDDLEDWTIDYTPVDESEVWSSILEFDLQTEEGRITACEERAGFYLNFNEWTFTWENESEWWASFIRNGHVTYLKWWENAEDDVECIVDMVDWSVIVEFSNHIYNGELQEQRTVTDAPVAKMRVVEWQTEEETQAMIENACSNAWWHLIDWLCTLEDGAIIAF